jgi:hypothetical protein
MPAPKDAELAVRTTVQRELHPGRHELSQRQQYRLLIFQWYRAKFRFLVAGTTKSRRFAGSPRRGSADVGERVGSRRARSSPSAASQALR